MCRGVAGLLPRAVPAVMGRQHALTGVLAGVGVAAAIPSAPWPIRLLAVAVTGGAALLPDLDHRGATAARSLGLLTKLLARAVNAVSLAVYHASREGGDPAERRDGHRTLTHTLPGCLFAASLVAAGCLLHPIAGASCIGLLAGLLGLGLRLFGIGAAAAVGGVGWWALTEHPSWWWVFPLATGVGCLVHILGDAVTVSGVPLLWPLMSQGRRWRPVTTPVTFSAGDAVETALVAPLLLLGVVAASGGVLGLWPVLYTAAVAAGGS